ncbi:hypothetical protein LUQ84_000979 [Hamiltosporidium tvaerminnensis]|nr:hypothetical protein LUQ84_000979 [Hamiltosporidium tvaerminnensis]
MKIKKQKNTLLNLLIGYGTLVFSSDHDFFYTWKQDNGTLSVIDLRENDLNRNPDVFLRPIYEQNHQLNPGPSTSSDKFLNDYFSQHYQAKPVQSCGNGLFHSHEENPPDYLNSDQELSDDIFETNTRLEPDHNSGNFRSLNQNTSCRNTPLIMTTARDNSFPLQQRHSSVRQNNQEIYDCEDEDDNIKLACADFVLDNTNDTNDQNDPNNLNDSK